MALSPPHARTLLVAAALAAATLPLTGGAAGATTPVGQSAAVGQDCASGGRIQETVVNNTAAPTTFTLSWPGNGTWTASVAAFDSAHFYFTKPSGTAYSFRTTTPEGFDRTVSGTLDCSNALDANVSLECPRNADGSLPASHRLRVTLDNRTVTAQTFTVAWPGRPYSPWTVTVPAMSGDSSLYWTVPNGTPYTFNLSSTTSSWSESESGTASCGLAAGTPGMNAQTVLTTSSPIGGVNTLAADGVSYTTTTTTAKSVRIPALAETASGTVIATADARIDGGADLGGGTNNIQVAMVRSTDGGVTFSAPRIIAHPPTTKEGYGDSSLLVDRTTGRVFCFFTYSPKVGVGYYGSTAGDTSASAATNTHISYVYSDDDGATWSSVVDLNPSVRDASWAGMFASSGHGVQLASGRLVQPMVYHDAAGDHAANLYSDDHGASWHSGGSAATGVNESKAIQRGTGKVVQNMRSNAGGNRWYATAAGAGDVAGAFGAAWNSGLLDPGCNGDEVSYLKPTDVDAAGRPLLSSTAVLSNAATSNNATRQDLTVRISQDDGASWPHRALLKAGPSGYSSAAVLNDGTVADLYEIGSTGGIVYTAFTTAWVSGS
ncbi:exo-alpha-sialidase [Streptomyces sp. TLI_171]|uniref:exo-alpha-sialidase n=1 Tax=Streptomyces sp. TLI_171 TaxID=1938859 RepID=UPI000C59BDB1|nr:exo-alpha-sialidase [Streptomyces sp. TLI_171]RKE17723.1 sialidase-1 [Streptomyces sp. TLI_171]